MKYLSFRSGLNLYCYEEAEMNEGYDISYRNFSPAISYNKKWVHPAVAHSILLL